MCLSISTYIYIYIGALGVLVCEIFDASADMQGGELKKDNISQSPKNLKWRNTHTHAGMHMHTHTHTHCRWCDKLVSEALAQRKYLIVLTVSRQGLFLCLCVWVTEGMAGEKKCV